MTNLFVGDLALGPEPDPKTEPGETSPRDPRGFDGVMGEPASTETAGVANLLLPFAPAIMAVRWATTGVSMALASPALLQAELTLVIWVTLVLANTVFRTFAPLRYTGSVRSMIMLFTEIGLHVLAVIATGYWESPLVLVLINAVIIAGFARGFGFAIRVGAASTLAVTVPGFGTEGWPSHGLAQSAQWATLLCSSGIVAGYTRRISGEATRRHSLALDRVARLADANALLANLHRVAQTLPASLDQGDVLDSTLSRLRGLVAHDSVVILTWEEPNGGWRVARQVATGLSSDVVVEQLPRLARRVVAQNQAIRSQFDPPDDQGFGPHSRSGLHLPLLARGRLIGLLAVESRTAEAFSSRDQQMLEGFVEPVALAIDNARWFDRIRTVGADEERTRIARELHDRIGQSLAYLGFEIDRMIRRQAEGNDIGDRLRGLRHDLRGVIVEVRDTLSDLRTDVTDSRDFAQTAQEFVDRLAARSDLRIAVDCVTNRRLPILQEREMWRIAQEALTNVERHAQASEVTLRWRCDNRGALLEVVDDGQGLPARSGEGRLGRPDSYGIVGMRERADSVGATLELTSIPGEGTKVRCFLAQR